MKVQTDANIIIETCNLSEASLSDAMDRKEMTNLTDKRRHILLHNQNCTSLDEINRNLLPNTVIETSGPGFTDIECNHDQQRNGTPQVSALENEISDFVNESRALGEETTEILEDSPSAFDEDLSYELQQAYRIFNGFLLEKHKGITAPFMHAVFTDELGDVERVQQAMCFKRIEEKFVNGEYETITDFVADFRLVLENCYRFHGVDHWISKQAQKLEIMLEQKLTLLSRSLREKTTLAVTSKGRFGGEEEKGPGNTTTRRRSMPRNLATIAVGANESIMVQALRLEEQQRTKVEKRQREQEKKEAEEVSAKELETWERSLLAKASEWPVETLWELPAIGHFLCLAQSTLNLPEIVFFELERCLLMPRCSAFLAKVMTSLLCHPQRRATLHRRPALTYRRWEASLRHKVLGWYQLMGQAEDTVACAEKLGLCPQFFRILGEVSPIEEKPFHLLPFNQRVWLLKGLCDFVYQTQKEVQDAVLGQPIHECRESILGYDGRENAYIHFPHFCGADLRIYCQSPSMPPEFPLPPIRVKKLKQDEVAEGMGRYYPLSAETEKRCRKEEGSSTLRSWWPKDDLPQNGDDSPVKQDPKVSINVLLPLKQETDPDSKCVEVGATEVEQKHAMKKEESLENFESREPCMYNSERKLHENTGELIPGEVRVEGDQTPAEAQGPCPACGTGTPAEQEHRHCFLTTPAPEAASSQHHSPQESSSEGVTSQTRTKKKKRKKKRVKGQGQSKPGGTELSRDKAAKGNPQRAAPAEKKKGKRKKPKSGKKLESKKLAAKKRKTGPKLPAEPTFKLVCSSLEELRVLISKTEDELEEFESTKKKSGKWYLRRQAVKDLHITLIRLLNELSPWEPKLVKAFQRNRARLKKDYDDFKKHPEYNSFVRENWTGDDGDGGMGRDSQVSAEGSKMTDKSEKRDQSLKKDPRKADDAQHQATESSGNSRTPRRETAHSDEYKPPTRNAKRGHSGAAEEEWTLMKRIKAGGEERASSAAQEDAEAGERTQATENSAAETSKIMTPVAVFPKGSKPIQALLAKSVGNKVTLISQPTAAALLANQMQNKPEVQPRATKPLPGPAQVPPPASSPKNPVHIVYKMPDGLDRLRKGSSPVKIALQPVLDQKTGEKIMQQVIILPTTKDPQQQTVTPTSSTSVVLPNVPGIPRPSDANKIPIQQVAPLTEAYSTGPSTAAVSPGLPVSQTSCYMSVPVSKTSNVKNLIPNRSSISCGTAASSSKAPDPKQELKTVCIRDSQSILVTTRGGNTGVVKVQTSNQTISGSLAPSPVITISPQFQAFLVSKSSPSAASTAPAVLSNAATASPLTAPMLGRPSPFARLPLPPPTFSVPLSSGQGVGTGVHLALNQSQNTAQLDSSKCNTTAQPSISANLAMPAVPQNNISLPTPSGKIGMVLKQISPAPSAAQLSTKMDEVEGRLADRPPLQRVILVTAPSSVAPVVSSSVPSSSHSSSMPAPRLMYISQTPASVDYSAVGIPRQTLSADAMAMSLTSESKVKNMKMRLNLDQTIGNTSTSSIQNVQTIGLIQGLSAKLPPEHLNHGEQAGVPELDSKNTCVTTSRAGFVTSTSSGLILVHNNSTLTGSNPAKNMALGKVSGSLDGRTLTFSTLKTGNLVTSAVPAPPQQRCVSSPVPSLVPDVVKPVQSPVNKDPALISTLPVRSPTAGHILSKSKIEASSITKSIPFKMSPLTSAVSQSQTNSTSIPSQMLSNTVASSQPAQSSTVPPQGESTTTMQQKIMINTATHLSPGTQILINNTRFIVPAQGLGPGSHMLLISNPVSLSTPQVATSSPGSQQSTKTAGPLAPAPSVPQSPTKSTPNAQPLHKLHIPLPTSTVNVDPSYTLATSPRAAVGNAVRVSLSTNNNTTSIPNVSKLFTVTHTACQRLSSPRVMPSVQLSAKEKGISAAALHAAGNQMKDSTVLTAQTIRSSQSTKKSPLHVGLTNALPKVKLTSDMPPMGSIVSRTGVLPTAAVSPVGSTVTRIQSVPVATVLPISSTQGRRQVLPIATIQPTNNTVIIAPGPSVRTVRSESTTMPLGVTNSSYVIPHKFPLQVTDPAVLTSSASSRLMVSPDGAVLNAIRIPSQSGLTISKTLDTAVVTPSPSAGNVLPSLKTDDPLPSAQTDNEGSTY